MLCQKCHKNKANVKYTEIVNGEEKEMMLCEKCSHELGLNNINFNMPIDFSSFFGGLLEDDIYSAPEFMPIFQNIKEVKCNNCNMTYDEFVNKGKFGCEECYNVFSTKIDSILKKIHGGNQYLGRKSLKINLKNNVSNKNMETKEENNINKLEQDLKKAIAEERYEDAAKIRDEIAKLK